MSGTSHDLPPNVFSLAPQDIAALPMATKLAILKELRIRPLRRPAVTLQCATDVLAGSGTSGEELYAVTEQCLIAALECGQATQARGCLSTLIRKFGGKSLRVRKLNGLCEEAAGNAAAARKIYQAILRDVPNDDFTVKRQVAMMKAEGNVQGAIDILEQAPCYRDEDKKALTFQQVHSIDIGAAKELGNLYLQLGNVSRALFYAEETILIDPHDYGLHTRHGELAYSKKQYERATRAFCQSLRLNDAANNARAAYGLWLAAGAAIAEGQHGPASPEGSEATYKELQETAVVHLRRMYGTGPMAKVLEMMLRGRK